MRANKALFTKASRGPDLRWVITPRSLGVGVDSANEHKEKEEREASRKPGRGGLYAAPCPSATAAKTLALGLGAEARLCWAEEKRGGK